MSILFTPTLQVYMGPSKISCTVMSHAGMMLLGAQAADPSEHAAGIHQTSQLDTSPTSI